MGELLRGYTSKDENHGAGTATSSSSSSSGTAHAPAGSPQGGQFTSGNSGGSKPAAKPAAKAPAKPTPKPSDYKPVIPVVTKTGPMKLGAENDPAQVKQLQALLGVLGLGTPPTDGNFDKATQDAVKEAQKRLGLKQTGTASTTLLNKLIAAHALSPCVNRSTTGGDEYELLRAAVARGDFDDEEDRGRLIVRSGEILRYQRYWPLEDIEISRAHSDGRTVVAYATVFDSPYPVSDQYGEYDETVERSAFNKWLADGNISRAMCLYNHGYTIHGSPSDAYSVPLGQPLEITPDGRGLKTITRYNKGPDVDRVLEAIANGAIRGQSFRGRIVRSTPNNRRYSASRDGSRTMVVRHELGLTDYGPTPMPVNAGAEILAVRSLIAGQLGLSDDQFAELIRNYASTTPYGEPETQPATSARDAGAEEPPSEALRSASMDDIRRKVDVTRILEGIPKP